MLEATIVLVEMLLCLASMLVNLVIAISIRFVSFYGSKTLITVSTSLAGRHNFSLKHAYTCQGELEHDEGPGEGVAGQPVHLQPAVRRLCPAHISNPWRLRRLHQRLSGEDQ